MDQKNLEYLQKSLDYLGFGTRLNAVLEEGVYKGSRSFSIGINQRYIPAEFRSDPSKGVDAMHFEIRFSRSATSEQYFLNAVEAKLKRYNAAEPISKRFDIVKDHRMTSLQCYKLMCGLSLQKDIFIKDLDDLQNESRKRVTVWFKLDLGVTNKDGEHPLKWFFPEYGFDLEKTVEKYPFLDFQDEEKKMAGIKALSYGNLISLSLELEGKKIPVYVSANPELKRLDVFSSEMIALTKQQLFPDSAQKSIDLLSSEAQSPQRMDIDSGSLDQQNIPKHKR